MATKRTLCARIPGAMKSRYGMLPVCMAPLRANTCPKMSSQSAGWRARVMSSVKSWRSLRNSNSVMTNVFSMKPAKGWMKAAVIGVGLAKALGRGAFGGCVAEGATGIQGAAGIVDENVIQRVAGTKRCLELFAGAQRSHLAQVHDRDAITMALRFLQVMGGEEQGRAIVGPQINEVFPNRVARTRVQPDGRFIEEEHPRSMQSGLGDFQPADHAAGVLAHQAAAVRPMNSNASRMRPCCSRCGRSYSLAKMSRFSYPVREPSTETACGTYPMARRTPTAWEVTRRSRHRTTSQRSCPSCKTRRWAGSSSVRPPTSGG